MVKEIEGLAYIQVSINTRGWLKDLKLNNKETYELVLQRLIRYHNGLYPARDVDPEVYNTLSDDKQYDPYNPWVEEGEQ